MSYPFYSSYLLQQDVLKKAAPEELLTITRIFNEKAETPLTLNHLADEILKAGGNSIANKLRGHGVPYAELLFDTAKTLKIDDSQSLNSLTSTGVSVDEMDRRIFNPVVSSDVTATWKSALEAYLVRKEKEIISKFIEDAYSRMSPEQRQDIDSQVQKLAEQLPGKNLKGLGSSAALLLVANAGGFATYMLMSTVISTLTLGAASFTVYTAASTALSVVLGPVGWTALGLATVYKLASPNQRKSLEAVVGVVMIRGRLSASNS